MRKLFIPFIALFFAASAMASAPQTMYSIDGSNWFTSVDSACGARATVMTSANPGYVYSCTGSSGTTAMYKVTYNGGSPAVGSWAASTSIRCADGRQPDTSKPLADQCTPPAPKCSDPAGTKVSWTQSEGTGPIGSDLPSSGVPPYPKTSSTCGLTGTPSIGKCFSTVSNGVNNFYCEYSGVSNGSSAPAGTAPAASPSTSGATPSNVPPRPPDAQGNCPGGTVQGGVDRDGTPICMGRGTNPSSAGTSPKDSRPSTTTTTKSTDSAGNPVETVTEAQGNSDGSTTTTRTTTTTNPDGSKTSTTTTQTGNTAGGMQGQPDPPESDMCKQHPELTVCKNSSVSGSCGTIACQGDAIQCATLQQAAALRCKADEDDKAIKASGAFSLGQAAMSGADPLASSIPKPGNATNINTATSLNTSGWLGGGQCFPNKSFTFWGQTMTISFAEACSYLVGFRYALMIVASLVSFKILRGTFLQE